MNPQMVMMGLELLKSGKLTELFGGKLSGLTEIFGDEEPSAEVAVSVAVTALAAHAPEETEKADSYVEAVTKALQAQIVLRDVLK